METIVINTELYKKSAGGHEESHKCLLFTYDAIALMNENINRTKLCIFILHPRETTHFLNYLL